MARNPKAEIHLTATWSYMLALSVVQPFRFDPPSLRRMGAREQDAARIERKLQQRGIAIELFNERFESRMNTMARVVTALALLPLALASVRVHQVIIVFPLYIHLGIMFFAHYRAATTLRTSGRFAIFAAADFVVSLVLSTVLFGLVYLSVLLV